MIERRYYLAVRVGHGHGRSLDVEINDGTAEGMRLLRVAHGAHLRLERVEVTACPVRVPLAPESGVSRMETHIIVGVTACGVPGEDVHLQAPIEILAHRLGEYPDEFTRETRDQIVLLLRRWRALVGDYEGAPTCRGSWHHQQYSQYCAECGNVGKVARVHLEGDDR